MNLRRIGPLGLYLAPILFLYIVIGTLFAIRIPAWQTPDEPAHYNYVKQLAQTGTLPVIEPSDWTPGLVPIGPDNRNVAVERITYEDHQPALFYALSVPVFRVFSGDLVALRLFSLVISVATIVFAFLTVRVLFPQQPGVAAFAAAFVALLPQHVHMMAGFNNDSLSEALLAMTLFVCVQLIVQGISTRKLIVLAVIVGLALLTKAQAYLTLPLAGVGLWMAHPKKTWRVLGVPALACLMGAPLWLRNMATYGGLDFLGLQKHNAVVVGQPTTAMLIEKLGLGGALFKLLRTTFQSFWGQFGWMTIPLSDRFYLGFLAFTLASAVFFGLWWVRAQSAKTHTPAQNKALTLMAFLMTMAVLAFAWYNLQFEQHQGRYLYPALIPIATAFSLGWHFVLGRFARLSHWLWLIFTLIFAALDAYLLLRVILPQMKV
jgi:4-amino-4-deoxy-L-arabinose transferase-like glycosyltransferase